MQLVIMTSSHPMASVIVANMKKINRVCSGVGWGGGARGVLFVLIL